jgi:predicted RND superfamily exporter protein
VYRLTRLSLSYPKSTLLVIAVITAILAGGLPRLRTEFGYRVLIGDDHPSIQTLDRFIAQFGGGLPVQIAWECGDGKPCKTVFDRASLEMAHTVARELTSLAGIQTVQGPANAALLLPTTGGFAVRRFVENGEVVSDAEALAVRALDDPLWVGTLVSGDGAVGVIVVQPTDTQSGTNVAVVDSIAEVLAPFESRGFEYYTIGDAVETIITGRDLARSTSNLIPVTVLVIALILFMLSRSWQLTSISLVTMGVALVWTLGLLGWLEWPRDSILQVLAPLILIVGVCDAVHLLSRFSAELDARDGGHLSREREEALLAAARGVGRPCFLTTLTTSGAFFSFVTSALDTFVRFGVISAFGVLACLTVTFSLLPVLVRALPASGPRLLRTSQTWRSVLDAVIRTSDKRAVPILVTSAVLLVVCSIGWLGYLRVDTHWLESWGEQSQQVKSIRFIEDHLGPSQTFETEIVLPSDALLVDPANLRTIATFSDFLSSIDGFGAATSVLDIVQRLNRLLHDDDPAFERPGRSVAANAEILELVSFEGPRVLSSWVSLDRSRLRISVVARSQSYTRSVEILEAVREYVRSKLPSSWALAFSGEFAINLDWIKDVQGTQLRSFPTAFVLVFVMVGIFLRSVRLAVAAMVPTLLPVVVTLGAMGWMGMSLDVGRAMIAAVLIGIAVDDSIHVLDQYRRRRADGDSPGEAIRQAVLHVGRAVVTTSVALALGFLTLMASAWQTISSFGFFVALAILGALAAALFVLPALIFALERGD